MAGKTEIYEVEITRVVRQYITVTVRASSPVAARRRALKIAQYEIGAAEGEERGDWMISEFISRRPRVDSIEVK